MKTSITATARRPESGHEAEEPRAAVPDRNLAVQAVGLTKHYLNPWTLRRARGLESLSLSIHRGEVLGLLGPNGAGKTTTMKILTGLLRPSAGRAWILGEPVDRTASRRRLGFLPEQPYFYDYLTGLEYLELAGQLSGLGGHEASRRARRWLGRVGLGDRPRLGLRKYSKGMLQRLGLGAALLHEPEVLILDEPMSGLDPFGRRDVRELIREQHERGTTVLFSSHILPDVEMLCDRVAIMLEGRLASLAPVGELVHDTRHRVEIRCTGVSMVVLPGEWRELVRRWDTAQETVFELASEELLSPVLEWLLRTGVRVRAVTPQRASLEELFIAAAGAGAGPGRDRRSA